jgi:1,4-alpha-glucan branching enzyme
MKLGSHVAQSTEDDMTTGTARTPHAVAPNPARFSLLTRDDLYLFNQGRHFRLYEKLGSHVVRVGDRKGAYFAVWAPNAESVSLISPFNNWDRTKNPLSPREQSGIWEGFVPDIGHGAIYKYHIASRHEGYKVDKADPLARCCEMPPSTASVVWESMYDWCDADWMAHRRERNALKAPMSIYELHLGSWMKQTGTPYSLGYREVAEPLVRYLLETGFTHVELLPIMEHPLYRSWGYQTTAYFAPTRRFGDPEDLMYLIDRLHQAGIGVILDWVPSHFPQDEHGLNYFDGTHLYEHADPKIGIHRDWDTLVFNYGRDEVRSFLISSALYWLDRYHADGLRVDAVASMLYLDYSRKPGEWIPNKYGGNENIEAIAFLRQLNEAVYQNYPDVQTMAEESTAWPAVSKPTYVGGLGFGLKWDMGWMHDTLNYLSRDPIYRGYHHNQLTFRGLYMFCENFALPLSHDEVVHGKGSLIGKMPGDNWQKFANLRLLFGYMYAQPGKKLLFMGGEIGQWYEWDHDGQIDWELLRFPMHCGVRQWVGDLNRAYRREPGLHVRDCHHEGFEWVDADDSRQCVLSFMRHGESPGDAVLIVGNCTPVPRLNYRVGVTRSGFWTEILNSDAEIYGGSGMGNGGGVEADATPWHGRPLSLNITLPPLGILFFKIPKAGS